METLLGDWPTWLFGLWMGWTHTHICVIVCVCVSIYMCNYRRVDINFYLCLSIACTVFSSSSSVWSNSLPLHLLCVGQDVRLFSECVSMELSVLLSVIGCLPFSLALSVSLLFLAFAFCPAAVMHFLLMVWAFRMNKYSNRFQSELRSW